MSTIERVDPTVVALCTQGMAILLSVAAKESLSVVEGLRKSWPSMFRWTPYLTEMLLQSSAREEDHRFFLLFLVSVVEFFEILALARDLHSRLVDVILNDSTLMFIADVWRRDYSHLPPEVACTAEQYASRLLCCGYSTEIVGPVSRNRCLDILMGTQTPVWVLLRFRLRIRGTMSKRPINADTLQCHLQALRHLMWRHPVACELQHAVYRKFLCSGRFVSFICIVARKLLRFQRRCYEDDRILAMKLCLLLVTKAISNGPSRTAQVALRNKLLETVVLFSDQLGDQPEHPNVKLSNLPGSKVASDCIKALFPHLSISSSISAAKSALDSPVIDRLRAGWLSLYPRLREEWQILEEIMTARCPLQQFRMCANVSCSFSIKKLSSSCLQRTCGKQDVKSAFQRCAVCGALYCSRDCQRKDWKQGDHRLHCADPFYREPGTICCEARLTGFCRKCRLPERFRVCTGSRQTERRRRSPHREER